MNLYSFNKYVIHAHDDIIRIFSSVCLSCVNNKIVACYCAG